jgi:hypothetical protein
VGSLLHGLDHSNQWLAPREIFLTLDFFEEIGSGSEKLVHAIFAEFSIVAYRFFFLVSDGKPLTATESGNIVFFVKFMNFEKRFTIK